MTKDLKLSPIQTLADALTVRQIRNECSSFMTHDTSIINEVRQRKWFKETYQDMAEHGEMTNYILKRCSEPTGFDVIRL